MVSNICLLVWNTSQHSRLHCPISKIRMILLMGTKIWMTSLIIMFAVRPICIQDSIFKMSSESPASAPLHGCSCFEVYNYYKSFRQIYLVERICICICIWINVFVFVFLFESNLSKIFVFVFEKFKFLYLYLYLYLVKRIWPQPWMILP